MFRLQRSLKYQPGSNGSENTPTETCEMGLEPHWEGACLNTLNVIKEKLPSEANKLSTQETRKSPQNKSKKKKGKKWRTIKEKWAKYKTKLELVNKT